MILNQISLTHRQITLLNTIKRKGRDEQEKQFLFPSLYGNKAVTKNTKGLFKEYYRHNKSKSYIKYI